MQTPEERYIIDLLGLDAIQARKKYPTLFQHLLNHVKPERDHQKREQYREKWWIFAEARVKMRPTLKGISRYVATCQTAKHRIFTFLRTEFLPDQKIVMIALEDAFALGVLSSQIHGVWSDRTGSALVDRPVYNPGPCFYPFPFPDCTAKQKSRIRKIAEELDAHRKRQQAKFPDLTLTDMYNVLEKLRAAERPTSGADALVGSSNGEKASARAQEPPTRASAPLIHSAAFSPKDKQIHDHGLVSILKQLHDDLDAAVFDAYGWPQDLTDDQLLEKLVALNHQRAEEEKRGIVKYLRPEFQKP